MSIQHQAQVAMSALSQAFSPLTCHFLAETRKGGFSFTVVNEYGIARHTERLYPDQYLATERLQTVIARARKALVA